MLLHQVCMMFVVYVALFLLLFFVHTRTARIYRQGGSVVYMCTRFGDGVRQAGRVWQSTNRHCTRLAFHFWKLWGLGYVMGNQLILMD